MRKHGKFLRRMLLGGLLAAACCLSAGAAYTDVPAGHWAAGVIEEATACGVMEGRGNGVFGLGEPVTRAEFAVMLGRLMGWTTDGQTAAFPDVPADSWYAGAVAAAAAHDAVDAGTAFRPNAAITREEMAVMLVRALGYKTLAADNDDLTLPFTDVKSSRGAIAMAADFGIIQGMDADSFAPGSTATREQAAAMMMRLRARQQSGTDWLHGFYAISSWSQHELGGQMDSVSLGWARLELADGKPSVNTTSAGGNTWRIPDGYTDATEYYAKAGVETMLAVQMTDQEAAQTILTSAANRADAAAQLVGVMQELGCAGVTVDFEGMKGTALRDGLTAFVSDLRAAGAGKIYVCAHPVLKAGGSYYDAYDFRALGEAADRVILMAHDYAATTLTDAERASGWTTTPVSPIEEVYYALRCALDDETGVQQPEKLALGLSVSSTAGWTLDGTGRVVNATANHPSAATILTRLAQADTVVTYSDKYRNPQARYVDDNGSPNILWYEDGQSVSDKLTLARLFGVQSMSVWRLGEIPTESARPIWQALTAGQ